MTRVDSLEIVLEGSAEEEEEEEEAAAVEADDESERNVCCDNGRIVLNLKPSSSSYELFGDSHQQIFWQSHETTTPTCTMCKIANFEGQMGGHNLNKIDGFLVSREYI